jgi:hypothetical protein
MILAFLFALLGGSVKQQCQQAERDLNVTNYTETQFFNWNIAGVQFNYQCEFYLKGTGWIVIN